MSFRHWLADLRRCGLTCHFDSSGSSDHSESSTAAARERETEREGKKRERSFFTVL